MWRALVLAAAAWCAWRGAPVSERRLPYDERRRRAHHRLFMLTTGGRAL